MNGYCEQGVTNDSNFFQGNSLYSSRAGTHSCLCDADDGTRTTPSDRESYEWVSNDCTMVSDYSLFINYYCCYCYYYY